MNEVERRLRDRIAELESLLGIDADASLRYEMLGLQPIARRMLAYIVKREVATRDGLFVAIYGERPDVDQPDIVVVNQHIMRIRNAIEPHGLLLRTLAGVGYAMPPADKVRLDAVLARMRSKLESGAAAWVVASVARRQRRGKATLKDPADGQDIHVNMRGSLSWMQDAADGVFTSAQVGVSATLKAKPAV